jgi:hypothetical protein
MLFIHLAKNTFSVLSAVTFGRANFCLANSLVAINFTFYILVKLLTLGVNVKLDLKIFSALCSTKRFTINGISADSSDFGSQTDEDPENAEDYGCGDMRFRSTVASNAVLEKYNITADEYKEVCEKLEEGLSFGSCGWCV